MYTEMSGSSRGQIGIPESQLGETPYIDRRASDMIFKVMPDKRKKPIDLKVYDDRIVVSLKQGNGQLRREVWQDQNGHVTRYNLAYINPILSTEDNGRVIEYDNAHGYHHKHYYGETTPIDDFISFEDIEDRFEKDWTSLIRQKPWKK